MKGVIVNNNASGEQRRLEAGLDDLLNDPMMAILHPRAGHDPDLLRNLLADAARRDEAHSTAGADSGR